MKNVLTLLAAALTAVSFASVAMADHHIKKDEVKTESTVVTPAGETKTESKEVKESVTKKKSGKKIIKKSVKEKTTTTPAVKGKKKRISGC